MALTSGFFNALNHDRQYEAVQVGSIFDGIIRDGVFATEGQALAVTASGTGLIVNVGTGRAWFNHTWTLNDAILPIEADEAEIVLDRIDALVLEVDASLSGRTNSIKFVKGTPSSTPVKPTLINTDEIHQYALAYVSIKAEQTLIEQQDIENAIGTEATPFVTGILETVDVTMLIAQWQAQFEAMMRDDQQDFTNWEILTKAAYETWFAGVQEQMEEDMEEFEGWEEATKTEFDSWFQNLQDELDENQAAHLQRQIGNLNALATSTKTDLVSAINEVNSRITTSISEILLDYDADLVGTVVTLSHTASMEGHTPESYEITLVEPEPGAEYEVEQDVKNLGEWIISWTYQGQSHSETLDVHYYGYYHVVLNGGFSWRQWATAGGVSIFAHETLAELLADEKAVRQLCLVHNAVDYFCGFTTISSDQETVINNDIFAKWVSLSDYSMDKMEANTAIKAAMDEADKYGYGEWALVSQVPVMTSNTAPYGEVGASSAASSYDAYKAFDDNVSTSYLPTTSDSSPRLYYKFVNSVCIKKIYAEFRNVTTSSATTTRTIKIQASNDGTTWTDLATTTIGGKANNTTEYVELSVNNDDYYLYYALNVTSAMHISNNYILTMSLQFYAWAPKGNVPVMTSNTAPYGEASAVSPLGSAPAYMAFDSITSTHSTFSNSVNNYLRYKFVNPVKAKKATIYQIDNNKYVIKASNDGTTWDTISSEFTGTGLAEEIEVPLTTNNYYLQYEIVETEKLNTGASYTSITELQFYGRELKVSVPTMTSNTAPYGEVVNGGTASTSANWLPYQSFNYSNLTTACAIESGETKYVGYDFGHPVVIKEIFYNNSRTSADNNAVQNFNVIASNNGNDWTIIESNKTASASYNSINHVASDNETPYRYYAIQGLSIFGTGAETHFYKIYFYGKDYSEKEFANDGGKWLYDHGVELETINKSQGGITENAESILLTKSSSYMPQMYTDKLNLTDYGHVFANASAKMYKASSTEFFSISINENAEIDASNRVAIVDVTNKAGHLDISSIAQLKRVCLFVNSANGNYVQINEWWLE